MTIVERIYKLIEANNSNANRVIKACGFNNNIFTFWKNGRQKPSLDALLKIAEHFNVSLDYFVGRESQTNKLETNNSNKAVSSTLLNRIESLDELQQAKVMAYIDGLQDTKPDSIIAKAVERGITNKQKDKTKIS